MTEQHRATGSYGERARAVIPGGMYGHQSAGPLPAGLPAVHARRPRGADLGRGRERVRRPDVQLRAGRARPPASRRWRRPRRRRPRSATARTAPARSWWSWPSCWCATVRHADWAMFAKNGTDATTMCCTIARAQTGRRKILVAAGRLPRRRALVHAAAGRRHRRRTAPTSATTPTTTSPACGRPPPRPAMTWRPSWSARSSTTPGTTRSWSTRRSPAACARCATPPGPR